MSKKQWLYTGFFAVLLVVFYFFIFWGTGYGTKKISLIRSIKNFTFVNQDGQYFSEQDMLGKVSVVEYFFTTCTSVCPRMNKYMDEVYDEFKDEKDFQIVAHTSLPAIDTVARLKRYADSLNINTKKWVLLTGRKDSLYSMARNVYGLDDPNNQVVDIKDDFVHTQFFRLVDKNGNVRGAVYDGLKKEDINLLKEDIKILLKEKQGGNSGAGNVFGNSMK